MIEVSVINLSLWLVIFALNSLIMFMHDLKWGGISLLVGGVSILFATLLGTRV